MEIGAAGKCQIVLFAEMHVKPLLGGSMFGMEHLYSQKSFIDKLRDPLVNMGNARMGQNGHSSGLPDQFKHIARLDGEFFFIGGRVIAYILFKGLSKRVNQFFLEQRRGNVGPADRGPVGNIKHRFKT